MKAVIYIDVPEWQIGQNVSVYFPDTMLKHGICEAVKIPERPEKLLPCICGCKKREHWYSTGDRSIILICCKCKREASGKNEIEAHKKWNEMILKEKGEVN